MKQEYINNGQTETPAQSDNLQNEARSFETAFDFLKSLPRNLDRSALESYMRGRSSVIDSQVAADFTDSFRGKTGSFFIPVSWTLEKSALLNLLGITSHQGYPEVSGIRFYGGLNDDNYLTLIAVSTTQGTSGNDDLTIADNYPYYDYADMCPSHCSTLGNLRVMNGPASPLEVTVV